MTKIDPATFAAAYSAKFGKPMTVEEAVIHLKDAKTRADANAKTEAHSAKMHTLGYVCTPSSGWITQEAYTKTIADAEAAVAELDLDWILALGKPGEGC